MDNQNRIFCFTQETFNQTLQAWLDRKLDPEEEPKRAQVVNAFNEFLTSDEAVKLRVKRTNP